MAMKEINKFSDISFEFEETKIGRKVTGIKFIIKQNQNNKARNEIAATLTVLREEIGTQPQKNIDDINLVKAIISEDIKDLEAIIIDKPSDKMINEVISLPEVSGIVIRRQVRTPTYVTSKQESDVFAKYGGFAKVP